MSKIETKSPDKQDSNPSNLNPIRIHGNKGKSKSKEHKLKMSMMRKGKPSWNKGLKYHHHNKRITPKWSEERKEAYRQLILNNPNYDNFKKSQIGVKYSDEYKNKMSKIAKSKGFGKWMKGKKHSLNTRMKMSEIHAGENSSFWQGGINKTGYPRIFNSQLKERIRVRDNFICQMCFIPELEFTKRLHIHHIDYIKNNCSTSNLISLCLPCHAKTNVNRKYWIEYFQKMSLA